MKSTKIIRITIAIYISMLISANKCCIKRIIYIPPQPCHLRLQQQLNIQSDMPRRSHPSQHVRDTRQLHFHAVPPVTCDMSRVTCDGKLAHLNWSMQRTAEWGSRKAAEGKKWGVGSSRLCHFAFDGMPKCGTTA